MAFSWPAAAECAMVLAGLFARVTRRLGIFGRPELIGVDVKRVIDGIVPLMIDFRRLGASFEFTSCPNVPNVVRVTPNSK